MLMQRQWTKPFKTLRRAFVGLKLDFFSMQDMGCRSKGTITSLQLIAILGRSEMLNSLLFDWTKSLISLKRATTLQASLFLTPAAIIPLSIYGEEEAKHLVSHLYMLQKERLLHLPHPLARLR